MITITDADRKAAEELRQVLADISGFWYSPGDSGPLCTALARYRAECEQRLMDKLGPVLAAGMTAECNSADDLIGPLTADQIRPMQAH